MATIEWRQGKRGRYAYLNWTERSGQRQRKSLGAVAQDEAEAALYAKEYELRTGTQVLSTAPLIGTIARIYLDWHKAEYPDSHFRTRQIIEGHILPDFRFVAADQVQPLQVERWKAERLLTASAGTVAKEIRTFKAMLNAVTRWGMIRFNPIAHVRPPQDRRSRPIHWYEMEQLHQLYTASPELRRAMWQLLANTGLRRSEGRYLRRENVRRDSLLIVSETHARTKSRKWREVPLTANGRDAARILLEHGHTDFLLPPMTGNAMTTAFRRDARQSGVGGTLHSLRHTFGTHQAMKGTPVRVLRDLMGHASIKTTEQYLHVAEHHMKDAMRDFNL